MSQSQCGRPPSQAGYASAVPERTFNVDGMSRPRLCGLSSRFQLLSPSEGQVAHVLLTRSPLSAEALRPTCMY